MFVYPTITIADNKCANLFYSSDETSRVKINQIQLKTIRKLFSEQEISVDLFEYIFSQIKFVSNQSKLSETKNIKSHFYEKFFRINGQNDFKLNISHVKSNLTSGEVYPYNKINSKYISEIKDVVSKYEKIIELNKDEEIRLFLDFYLNSKIVESIFRTENSEAIKKLTTEEFISILSYTAVQYRYLNSYLRSSSVKDESTEVLISTLNRSLEKLPDYVGIVKRGISIYPGSEIDFKEGNVVTFKGFTSTSRLASFDGDYQLVINSLHGKDISPISLEKHEAEVLFKSNSKFKVTKIITDDPKYRFKKIIFLDHVVLD